jgi:hypothetical protein
MLPKRSDRLRPRLRPIQRAAYVMVTDDGNSIRSRGRQGLAGFASAFWIGTAGEDAVVDLWLLRHVDRFVGAAGSTYSAMASLGRGIPATMCIGDTRCAAKTPPPSASDRACRSRCGCLRGAGHGRVRPSRAPHPHAARLGGHHQPGHGEPPPDDVDSAGRIARGARHRSGRVNTASPSTSSSPVNRMRTRPSND